MRVCGWATKAPNRIWVLAWVACADPRLAPDRVNRQEFKALLLFLVYFCKVFNAFSIIDTDDDRRLTLDEFIASVKILNMGISPPQAKTEFIQVRCGRLGLRLGVGMSVSLCVGVLVGGRARRVSLCANVAAPGTTTPLSCR